MGNNKRAKFEAAIVSSSACSGFDAMTSEQAIQEILSYVVNSAEVQKTSAALIKKFGSLSAVLDAPEKILAAMPEVGMKTAKYLSMFIGVNRFYNEDKKRAIMRIFDTASACDVMRPKFLGRKNEVVALLILDGRGYVLYNGIVNEGSIGAVPIYIRRIVDLCIQYNGVDVMIAHNHPSGNPAPSKNDIVSTEAIKLALDSIDVEVKDHIIFTDLDFYSMKTSGLLDEISSDVRAFRKKQMQNARANEEIFLEINSQE